MKKIIYSNITKIVAVVLLIACSIVCMNSVIDGMEKYFSIEPYSIYGFEEDFNESRHIESKLYNPVEHVYSAYNELNNDIEENLNIELNEEAQQELLESDIENYLDENTIYTNKKTVKEYLEESLNYLQNSEEINYFIKINDDVFTFCGSESKEELLDDRFYFLAERDSSGNTNYDSSNTSVNGKYHYYFNGSVFGDDNISVCTSIKDDYAAVCEEIWIHQEKTVRQTFWDLFVYILIMLLLLIYLIAVSGKTASGEYKTMWVDSIWTEVHLGVIVIPPFLLIALNLVMFDEMFMGQFPMYMAKTIALSSAALGSLLFLTSTLSIVRKIKCKTFVEGSIILRAIRWAWRMVLKVFKFIRKYINEFTKVISGSLSKKTDMMLIGMLFFYTALIGICGIVLSQTALGLLFGILIFAFACVILVNRIKDVEEIKRGASEIRNGNLSYKIPEPKSGDLKALADDINEVAMGLDESVAAKLKAERLKTELITNVSHDLKTPLTSIISYTELLSKMDNLSEEAQDYIKVIAKKSERLKNLTQDLFDISKVQSGNESVLYEKIDVSLLINQSLGEHDNEIKKSGLPFCVDVAKELYISADGRKMSRVVSNLISNILKYTMPNTRVFISAFESGDEVFIEFKNIASYPMDFAADEIVGRFVRGDESRTAEGNGLGLAIAKSYTEVSGGKFEVILDGDMFKAIIKFRKIGK